jgi:3-oxoacyl-[acyl-carrier-protein] synthase II
MRIWTTGIGLVTPLAIGAEATWARLVRGERGLAPITLFATKENRARFGGEVRGLEAARLPGDLGDAWSRTAAMAHIAASEAIAMSGIDVRGGRVGLVVGGTTGGMLENEELLARVYADPSLHPELRGLLSHPLWATTDRLHETLGPFARVRTLSSACSSGANALIVAAAWLLSGDLDAVVAGGTDGLCRLTLAGFNALSAVDPEACRPFDAGRRGLNLGEGAGFVVLERSDRVRARGRAPLAELAGWSLGGEAHHITNPEPTGRTPERVMRGAVARAGLAPGDIDYVNAHGTATPLNDGMECAAIARAVAPGVAVSSSKGQIGHTLAAAGAIEAAITALVVARQTLVPTAGLREIDPACAGVSHVLGEGRAARVRAAMTNAFGFGGMDSALVFTEPERGREHGAPRRSVVVTAAATLTHAGLLGTRDSADALGASASPSAGPLPPLEPLLDVERARRLDRPARVGAIVVGRALEDANKDANELPDTTGLILGSSFGRIDASAAFMHRIFAKGARLASPADFPNLVPSSPVGHTSIYLGLRGPVLAASELVASGECATVQAAELIAAGEADAIAAGDCEEANGIIERVISALFAEGGHAPAAPYGEGGGAVILEAEDSARARGAAVVARVVSVATWRDGEGVPDLAPPRDAARAQVIAPRGSEGAAAWLAGSSWRGVPREARVGSGGEHEALGAIAIAAAVSRIARGEASDVLVVSLIRGRGYAIAFGTP